MSREKVLLIPDQLSLWVKMKGALITASIWRVKAFAMSCSTLRWSSIVNSGTSGYRSRRDRYVSRNLDLDHNRAREMLMGNDRGRV